MSKERARQRDGRDMRVVYINDDIIYKCIYIYVYMYNIYIQYITYILYIQRIYIYI